MKRFQDLEAYTEEDIEAALERNEPDELRFVPLTVAMVSTDPDAAQALCIRLCVHPEAPVRATAIMSLGHLARRFRTLQQETVRPLVEARLKDRDEQVRTCAKTAADEIHQFLHWEIAGHTFG